MTSNKRRPNSQFTPIRSVIEDILASYQRKPAGKMATILDKWPLAVGDIIAENAKPTAMKGSVLLVHVTSSTWLQQLRFLKKDILAKINHALKEDVIKDITFKIGTF